MKKYLLKLIIFLFSSHVILAQVSNGDTMKKSPLLKPVSHTTKKHSLERKKVEKEEFVKSESEKKAEKSTKKEEKTSVTKVEKEKKNTTVEKPEPKIKEKKSVTAETPATKSNTVALPESSIPTFKGGKKAMTNFINQNMIYPNNAEKNGIRGVVEFSCIVTKEGKLKDIKMTKALGFGCNEEALRLVKLMPDWEPGRANGQAVDMPAVFSISFKN